MYLNQTICYRLEELLIQYPPEEVEAKRFQKIAAALGNRTPIQVFEYVDFFNADSPPNSHCYLSVLTCRFHDLL